MKSFKNDSSFAAFALLLVLFAGCKGAANSTADGSRTEPDYFRVALSLSPFSLNQFDKGYSFEVGEKTASTPEELQEIYLDLGSTEMFVRFATKRHVTDEDITDGEPDPNANVHTFDQGIRLCRIAAKLGIPVNPEIMCAFTYMDMDRQQAPRFDEYPEIYALQNGKDWPELSLEEIKTVLEAYGAFIGEAVLGTGCTVNDWNLGNEANFGFAGIGLGLETAVNPALKAVSDEEKYRLALFDTDWLEENLWKYEAQALASLRKGILSAYSSLGKDTSGVRFSTHIATVVATPETSAAFFRSFAKNGYSVDVAGISYYPSAPSISEDRAELLKETVSRINVECGIPVFIAEFAYPSGEMEGPYAGWNNQLGEYAKDQTGQEAIYADIIDWGKRNGLCGIRYWAPDYEGWYAMSMFEFSDRHGRAKSILLNHKDIIK